MDDGRGEPNGCHAFGRVCLLNLEHLYSIFHNKLA